MADYIIILYYGTPNAELYNGFFCSYEDAKEEAERNGEPYKIFVSCTDQRNYPV